MPRKCCIPGCDTNYRGKEYRTVFRFPKDENLKQKWLLKIPRQSFAPQNDSVVCERHFDQKFIVRCDELPTPNGVIKVQRKRPVLASDAYPTIFPNLPSYLSKSVPDCRLTCPSKRAEAMEQRYEEEFQKQLAELVEKNAMEDFSDLLNLLSSEDLCAGWTYLKGSERVQFILLDDTKKPSSLRGLIEVISDLTYTAYLDGLQVPYKELSRLGCARTLKSWDDIHHIMVTVKNLVFHDKNVTDVFENTINLAVSTLENLLTHAKDSLIVNVEKVSILSFVTEQLKLLNCLPNLRSYSSDTLLFAYMLFMKSPSAYELVRNSGCLYLPHSQVLRKMSAKVLNSSETDNNIHYLKQKALLLEANEKIVNMLVDEIHIQPNFLYKGGKIVGSSYDNTDALANSVHTVMISSVFSNNKDVVSFLPVKSLSAHDLYNYIKECISAVEDIGYQVFSIITDNNAINRKMFTLFLENSLFPKPVASHPCNRNRPLYLLFDTVHLLKCIRNNWLAQTNCFLVPGINSKTNEVQPAYFNHLIKVFNIEKTATVKYGYLLSQNVLFPTNIQKQNVTYALRVFDRSNVTALEMLGTQHADLVQWEGTAQFLTTIIKWWEIVNVKTCLKGIRKRNENMSPIVSFHSVHIAFLKEFLQWLEEWQSNAVGKHKGGLSKETFEALKHTTEGFIRLVHYVLVESNWKYVLLGKFQTDKLEARFGQYRQLSGCNYNVSLQQIYESEKKLKVTSLLQLKSSNYGSVSISELCSFFENDSPQQMTSFDVQLIDRCSSESIETEISENDVINLIYVVGYACYSVKKKLACNKCIDFLVTEQPLQVDAPYILIEKCDRGGLAYPSKPIVDIGTACYCVFQMLVSKEFEAAFIASANQLKIFTSVAENYITKSELVSGSSQCEDCGSSFMVLICKVIKTVGNVFLKNYSRKKFGSCKPIKAVKRKLSTLCKN